MSQVDQETLEFLEGLDVAGLGKLLNSPIFRGTVLEAATHSGILSANVDEVLDAEFEALPSATKEMIERVAKKLWLKYAKQ